MSGLSSVWIAARAIVYGCAFLGLWAWLAYEAHLHDMPFAFPLPGWVAPIGVALIPIGAALTAACVATLMLAGYALCAVSFAALLVAFAMLGAAHVFAVFSEEPALERRFGDSYLAYRRAMPRWIPRPPISRTREQ